MSLSTQSDHSLHRFVWPLIWAMLFLALIEISLEVRAAGREFTTHLFGQPSKKEPASPVAESDQPVYGPTIDFPFRSRLVTPEKKHGVVRIWLASFSHAEDIRMPAEDVFPTVLERILNEKGIRCQVLNASRWGDTCGSNTNLVKLLHYVTWMIDHEYRYLTKPEILEYPTETWAAQDMRKCEVFQWASLHTTGELRERIMERAGFFFDYSAETLSTMETRTLCRPIALLLSSGYSRAWLSNKLPIPVLPAGDSEVDIDFGKPAQFTPQKIHAINRAKKIALAGVSVCVVGVAWLTWRFLN